MIRYNINIFVYYINNLTNNYFVINIFKLNLINIYFSISVTSMIFSFLMKVYFIIN